jgi:hypothetical protein
MQKYTSERFAIEPNGAYPMIAVEIAVRASEEGLHVEQ